MDVKGPNGTPSTTNMVNTEREETPWRLLASLASSLLIVLGGMFWTYGIWRETNLKFHELSHMQEKVAGLRSAVRTQEARVR